MLEMLLAKNTKSATLLSTNGKAAVYAMRNARNSFAFAATDSYTVCFGGSSGNSGNNGGDPYPANYTYQNLNSATGGNTYTTGNSYTWAKGISIGNVMYVADGHNGAYANTFRKFTFINQITLVSLAPTLGTNRIGSIFVNVNDTKIFRYGGSADSGIQSSVSMYDIASNVWTALKDAPTPLWATNGWHYKGKIYIPFGSTTQAKANWLNTIKVYDIASDSWSILPKSPDPRLVPASGIAFGAGCIINGVIWYFTSDLVQNGVALNKLGLIKYFIDENRYEYYITPYSARWHFEVAVTPTNKDIYLEGGLAFSFPNANFETAPRVNEVLTFSSK